MMGEALSQVAAEVFGQIVVDAVLFLVCFIVLLALIEVALDITNFQTKGGD